MQEAPLLIQYRLVTNSSNVFKLGKADRGVCRTVTGMFMEPSKGSVAGTKAVVTCLSR